MPRIPSAFTYNSLIFDCLFVFFLFFIFFLFFVFSPPTGLQGGLSYSRTTNIFCSLAPLEPVLVDLGLLSFLLGDRAGDRAGDRVWGRAGDRVWGRARDRSRSGDLFLFSGAFLGCLNLHCFSLRHPSLVLWYLQIGVSFSVCSACCRVFWISLRASVTFCSAPVTVTRHFSSFDSVATFTLCRFWMLMTFAPLFPIM